ncbi:ABC transporter ATP-binding protein [Psychromarinibacter sp. C21-152]|uniref:ABC transporter ATP-binding protein n=1 Tax=Psychromarinibacter sediminicola TaxID=3033385 RepID=A0AAE3NVW8_9RHOB|nr:ABC transporter ATP-binding protein [Psychromarinibacter sediminicola]MDF0603214.1 ABC transporter ATP-binding protein [Psychromarinibacter sediminicola]
MSFVEFFGVTKAFGRTVAVEELNLDVRQGEFFSLLGPSGCGKSTTLRMLAGFIAPSTGAIHVHGRDITHLPPEGRDIGIVFQNYAIFPHMNVFDNIAFGLVERGEDRAIIKRKVDAALEQVGLSGYGERYERELSGGQKQRVALARLLVIEPEILLLDEPLSALDKKMREEMKFWIKNIQKSVGITTIYVTHDQSEALTMSDRIAVMNQGQVLQVGTPVEIYEHPNSRFIAEFIGESNLLSGRMGRDHVAIGDTAVPVSGAEGPTDAEVALLVRPEQIRLEPVFADEAPMLKGRVADEVYQGSLRRYLVETMGQRLTVEVPNRPDLAQLPPGADVSLYWRPESGVVLR